ncbi:pyruvate:ferredoxin (flavodoxin) oxidoreductase [Parasporobacterium paucivorans]|uniref:Pyruvate:ferredoxin oxidoreductase n=1 Tax=Parasporobacterium paucivorans DSM 15970 TaxID=1122934 RepID=A0A1M6F7R7_9FIRM|nr:pyruvate:ferredoxin (flavodoxin) oxidoreductase [Parasporobacterium paucivorans]SHI93723.1 pyruvate-ferredoxin/flavodoxin oxidoreductase [Parasporobacterium paucivorans DSM 15970]
MARKMKTMDGNTAAAHVSYAYSDVAAIYPITPSSVMAELADKWSTEERENIFGQEVAVTEMQSEAGAAGAVHGSLTAGALTTTFTCSQGLLLMIPNLYKMAGERLPAVFDVSARAIATHALSIFGDQSDIYACRQTGSAILCCSSVQEVMDLTPVSHLSAIKGRMPFINFFDGFRTSHELQKIQVWDYEQLKDMMDMEAVEAFRNGALNPNHPVQMGSAQNPDIFFQVREAANTHYSNLIPVIEDQMKKVNEKIGTDYKFFNYYGAEDAEHVIIAMGSVCETIEETIDYLVKQGHKVGVIKVRVFRPFSAEHLLNAIPDSVKKISVLDKSKEPGAVGEPLYMDVVTALKGTKFNDLTIFRGRYGLGSKDTNSAQIISVFKNNEKPQFTLGINDDITGLSLDITEAPLTAPDSIINCKFWGLGADGTVGANKNSIKIIGDNTDMYAQAYFDYDSKKSGGVTISHLRFGNVPIKSTYLIDKANFVACHNPSYVRKYNMVQDLKEGGAFLLNCSWDMNELEEHLPGQAKRYMAENNIQFYTIDGIKVGKEIGLGGRINTVLQSAFFKLSNIIPEEKAIELMKAAALSSYGNKGEDIVNMNYKAIERGAQDVHKIEIPASWKNAADEELGNKVASGRKDVIDFVNNIQSAVNSQNGNSLPVSAFTEYAEGNTPLGTAAYEKRGIAVDVPEWDAETCIQCNQCSYVCPHACIRPVVMTEAEYASAPAAMKAKDMTGMPGYKFAITITPMDCTGCGSCVAVCPGNKKAQTLKLQPLESQMAQQEVFAYAQTIPAKEDVTDKFKETTVKGSQFKQPLLEFSGACAGCGETPYAKLVTQLFGDRMYIANATGCSSIWGNSSPSTPYTCNSEGKGPAWSNSLFEDNAEFGFGMKLAQDALRKGISKKLETLAAGTDNTDVKAAITEYFDTYNEGSLNRKASNRLIKALEACGCSEGKDILKNKDFISKKSQWIFGGDGWAYDIGFGGVDHVIASGQDVNILVMDTEVYSNTGGQSSKATPLGAVAQFAAGGKPIKQKDLAAIAMSYGYVYVAQISQGADYNQCIKALAEAESYNGPSLVIAYAPCINHGIRGGMKNAQLVEKTAVTSGYWNLFRFDPRRKEEGLNPLVVDSKQPSTPYRDFLTNEVRFSSLMRKDPEKAERLFAEAEKNAMEKYSHLEKLANM